MQLTPLVQSSLPQWQVHHTSKQDVPCTVSKSVTGLHIRRGLQIGVNNLKQAWLLLDAKLANRLQLA